MERFELEEQLRHCPLLVRMNDGREYVIEKREFIMLSDYAASVLVRRDGELRHGLMSLLNITMVEPMGMPGPDGQTNTNGSPSKES